MSPSMLRLICQTFAKLLGWIVLRTRSDTTTDAEILWGFSTWHTLLTSGDRRSGMIAARSPRLLDLIPQQVLRLVLLLGRTTSTKDGKFV